MLADRIRWAGRTLSGEDRYGRWVATGLEGWWDSPEPQGEAEAIPYGDGEYNLPVYNAARLVTVTGNLHARNHDELHHAMHSLTGVMKGKLYVDGHGESLWADAVRNGAVRFTPVTDTFAQWQVRLKCPDPRKFGEERIFNTAAGESIPVHHKGNYSAIPKFYIRGNMPGGYRIALASRTFTVNRALVGVSHSIDYRDGRLRVGDDLVTGAVSSSVLFQVLPGQRDTLSLTPLAGGYGWVQMNVHDTYI